MKIYLLTCLYFTDLINLDKLYHFLSQKYVFPKV